MDSSLSSFSLISDNSDHIVEKTKSKFRSSLFFENSSENRISGIDQQQRLRQSKSHTPIPTPAPSPIKLTNNSQPPILEGVEQNSYPDTRISYGNIDSDIFAVYVDDSRFDNSSISVVSSPSSSNQESSSDNNMNHTESTNNSSSDHHINVIQLHTDNNSAISSTTDYYEANDNITNNSNNNNITKNGHIDLPINNKNSTPTGQSHNIIYSDNVNVANNGSAESLQTQNTNILDTRLRNIPNNPRQRESVRTVSTNILINNNNNNSTLYTEDLEDDLLQLRDFKLQSPPMTKKKHNTRSSSSKSVTYPMQLSVQNNISSSSSTNTGSSYATGNSQVSSVSASPNDNNNAHFINTNYHEISYSSSFHDEYNDTIEPNIEHAVSFLKNGDNTNNLKVNLINTNKGNTDENSIKQETAILPSNNNTQNGQHDTTLDEAYDDFGPDPDDAFVPHELKIPRKISYSSPTSPTFSQTSHVPRSPSLINKIFIPPSTPKQNNKPIPRSISTVSQQISLNSVFMTPQSQIIPKVQLLQKVSGPNSWRPNPSTEVQASILGGNEFRSPVARLSTSYESSGTNLPINKEIVPPMATGPSTNEPVLSTIPEPPLPAGFSTFQYNTTSALDEEIFVLRPSSSFDQDLESASKYMQHINSESLHSYDSQNYKFNEVYSISRLIMLMVMCLLMPPLFFMIGIGPESGIDDYKLMKFILNREHRIGLLRGFLWDIDLHWLRTLSLVLGCTEIFAILACVGIGFGVGLTR